MGNDRWEPLWKDGVEPGQKWDTTVAHPALVREVREGRHAIAGAWLVPGCGRGYEVAFLAKEPAVTSVVGLDIAPTGVAAASAYLASQDVDPAKGRVDLQDFFTMEGAVDGAFDLTFCCAIDPEQRPAWAEQYGRLVKPGGLLIQIIYPEDEREGGPPHTLRLEHVQPLLEPFFELVEHRAIPAGQGIEAREGRESLAIWRRKTGGGAL